MAQGFDAPGFVRDVGETLVGSFERARQATSPGQIGGAIEQSVRHKLEQLLPRGAAVGSGGVIDTRGGTSRQIDVVVYERDICPRFSVNDTPDSTYFPCEGVVAVGEVKSRVGTRELRDAFEKIASVKRLARRMHKVPLPFPRDNSPQSVFRRTTRNYGMTAPADIPNYSGDYEEFVPCHEVLGFVLTGELTISHGTALDRFCSLVSEFGSDASPDLLVSLDGTMIHGVKNVQAGEAATPTLLTDSDAPIVAVRSPAPFAGLVGWVFVAYDTIKTSEIEVFRSYLVEDSSNGSEALGIRTPSPSAGSSTA